MTIRTSPPMNLGPRPVLGVLLMRTRVVLLGPVHVHLQFPRVVRANPPIRLGPPPTAPLPATTLTALVPLGMLQLGLAK